MPSPNLQAAPWLQLGSGATDFTLFFLQLATTLCVTSSYACRGLSCNIKFASQLRLPRDELHLPHRIRLLAKVLLPRRLQLVPRAKARRLQLLRHS